MGVTTIPILSGAIPRSAWKRYWRLVDEGLWNPPITRWDREDIMAAAISDQNVRLRDTWGEMETDPGFLA